MLVLRNKNYRYQEKDFGLGDWVSGFFSPKYKTVDTGITVSGAPKPPPLPSTPPPLPPTPPPLPSTPPPLPFGVTGPQTRGEKRAFKKNWEQGNITNADKRVVMKREYGGESLNKFNKKLNAGTDQAVKLNNKVLHQSRVRNQQGVINLNTHEKPQSKISKGDEWLNRNVEGGTEYQKNLEALKKRAHDKRYMAQRRMERAQRVGQINKGPTSGGMGSNTAKISAPPPLIAASSNVPKPNTPPPFIANPSSMPQSNVPSFLNPTSNPSLPATPSNNPKSNNPNPNSPKPSTPNPNNPKPQNNPKPNNPKPNSQTTTPATSNAAKTNFKMSTGGKIGTGVAALGAGYLLYNHFKNKDKK